MNDYEKAQIIKFRDAGCSYGWIAKELGISKETIKSYCRRHDLSGYAKDRKSAGIFGDEPVRCKLCGNIVIQTPGRKKKQYCDDTCRLKWWNTHQEQVTKKANYEITCAYCGKKFIAYGNSSRKYCSHDCYVSDRFGIKQKKEEPPVKAAVPEPAESKPPMKKEQFDSELNYAATMHIAKRMMKEGIINAKEYNSIRKKMVEKYDPKLGALLYDEEKEDE